MAILPRFFRFFSFFCTPIRQMSFVWDSFLSDGLRSYCRGFRRLQFLHRAVFIPPVLCCFSFFMVRFSGFCNLFAKVASILLSGKYFVLFFYYIVSLCCFDMVFQPSFHVLCSSSPCLVALPAFRDMLYRIYLYSLRIIFFSAWFFCSKALNIHSKALNIHSKALNVHSKALNENSFLMKRYFPPCLSCFPSWGNLNIFVGGRRTWWGKAKGVAADVRYYI